MFFIAVFFLVQFLQEENKKDFYKAILFFCASVYIKESSVLFVLFCFILSFLIPSIRANRKHLLTIFVSIIICLLPWAYRNHAEMGKWVFLTTNSGLTIYDSFNPDADGGTNVLHFVREPEIWEAMTEKSELERDALFKQKTLEAIKENPSRVLTLMPKKLKHFWSPVPNADEFSNGWIRLGFAFYYVPLFLLALKGVISRQVFKSGVFTLLLLPILYYSCLHSIFIGSLKYRVPIEAFILFFAILGLKKLLTTENK